MGDTRLDPEIEAVIMAQRPEKAFGAIVGRLAALETSVGDIAQALARVEEKVGPAMQHVANVAGAGIQRMTDLMTAADASRETAQAELVQVRQALNAVGPNDSTVGAATRLVAELDRVKGDFTEVNEHLIECQALAEELGVDIGGCGEVTVALRQLADQRDEARAERDDQRRRADGAEQEVSRLEMAAPGEAPKP